MGKVKMEYLYFLANATLTLRIIEHLEKMPYLFGSSITVIHQIDGWIIRIKLPSILTDQQDGDFTAFLNELGIIYNPGVRMEMVFWNLDMGDSPVEVMRNYQIAIVSHGNPNSAEIEAFREQFTKGLGYRPETLA
jgi:hypothetical protein